MKYRVILAISFALFLVGCSQNLYVKMDISIDPFHPIFVVSSSKHFLAGWSGSLDFMEVGANGRSLGMRSLMWSIHPIWHGNGWVGFKNLWHGLKLTYGTLPDDWMESTGEWRRSPAKPLKLCTFYSIQGAWYFLIGKKDGQYYKVLLPSHVFDQFILKNDRSDCLAWTGMVK